MGNICFRNNSRRGLLDELRGQLCNRCHPLQKFDSSLPPLMRATIKGHDKCVDALLKLGADVNTPPNPGETALIVAAKAGYERVVALLIRAGADVKVADRNGKTALDYAEIKGHQSCVALLVQAGTADSAALISAAKYDIKSFVEELLQGGIDPNTTDDEGKTPLIHAAMNGHYGCAEVIIKGKADVNLADDDGVTPLMYAAEGGHTRCVGLLLDHGADFKVSAEATGNTAVLQAAKSGSHESLERLIKAGADVNKANNTGCTPLILAATAGSGSIECIKLLLKAGAHINTPASGGQNALQICSGRSSVYARKEKLMLLFAAGETFESNLTEEEEQNKEKDETTTTEGEEGEESSFYTENYLSHLPQQSDSGLSKGLKGMCREIVRKNLIAVNPHVHLFSKIKQLDIPPAVTEYLLYNVSL